VREIVMSRGKRETRLEDEEPFLSRQIPFGVFLGVCSLVAIFLGQTAWDWYLRRI